MDKLPMREATRQALKAVHLMTMDGAYYCDDRIVIYAPKTLQADQSPTGKKRHLPLESTWWTARDNRGWRYLQPIETGNYCHIENKKRIIRKAEYDKLDYPECTLWKPTHTYSLKHSTLAGIKKEDRDAILKDIRLDITENGLFITLTNVLMARADSRLYLLVETVRALHNVGIIKGNWNDETEKTRPYRILEDYFWIISYEVRFDSNMEHALPLYKKCERNSKWAADLKEINETAGEVFNTIPLVSPGTGDKKNRRKCLKNRGYHVKIYKRSDTPNNLRYGTFGFPVRLEIELFTKRLRDEQNKNLRIMKGGLVKIVKRIESEINSILIKVVKDMAAIIEFDRFVNGRETGNPVQDNITHLIKNRSIYQALELVAEKIDDHERRLQSTEQTLEMIGRTLPHQRGLKAV